MTKREYLVTRPAFIPSGRMLPDCVTVRALAAEDTEQLASLMLDAYTGTIDYEGEDLDDARDEVDRYLHNEAYLGASVVAERNGELQAAALLGKLAGGAPMVGYIMTRAAVKNRGLAGVLLDRAAASVWADGYDDLRAFITTGNLPSETVFTRAGFEVIAEHDV
jgi:RimJ/RimL family protein N-acetyltransferase